MQVFRLYLLCLLIFIGACRKEEKTRGVIPLTVEHLLRAAKEGEAEVVRRALADGVDVNARGIDDTTALMYAARYNSSRDVIDLLLAAQDIDINWVESSTQATALIIAAKHNSYAPIVSALVSASGMLVNTQDASGFTALMHAARASTNVAVVEELLKHGSIEVHLRNSSNKSAIDLANERSETDKVKAPILVLLKTKGARLPEDLLNAARNGNAEEVRKALEAGIDVNTQGDADSTALMYAARYNHTRNAIDLLLATHGIEVNLVERSTGASALIIAARWNTASQTTQARSYTQSIASVSRNQAIAFQANTTGVVAALLEDDRVQVDAQDHNRWNALMHAARYNSNKHVVGALVADIATLDGVKASTITNNKDIEGYTALMLAAAHSRHAGVLEELLESTVIDLNLENKDKHTALALVNKRSDMVLQESFVTLLEAHGAPTRAELITAVRTKIVDIDPIRETKRLLRAGVNVNAKGTNDSTALMYAARHNDGEAIVDTLLKANADLTLTENVKQATALMIAAKHSSHADVMGVIVHAVNALGTTAERMNVFNSMDSEGHTALMLAARYTEDIEVMNKLLEGNDLDPSLTSGNPPKMALDYAREREHSSIKNRVIAMLENRIPPSISEFYTAIRKEQLADVQQLITKGVNINDRGQSDSTALMIAARHNAAVAIVNELLSMNDISINAKTSGGWTALMLAAQYSSNADIVKALARDPRAMINTCNKAKRTAFKIAQERGEARIIAAFSSTSAAVVCDDAPTTLYSAIVAKDVLAIKDFITPVNVNEKIAGDSTALMIAARYANKDVVGALLNIPGIRINAFIEGSAETALMIAVRHANAETAQKLIRKGDRLRPKLYIQQCNKLGETAYDIAVQIHGSGARPPTDPKEIIVRTFSWVADNSFFTLPELLACGPRDLYEAIVAEQKVALHTFLSTSQINEPITEDSTALMIAARHNNGTEMTSELLSTANINVNLKTNEGWTALMLAAQYNSDDMVQKLATDPRAIVNTCNAANKTALKIAEERGEAEVIAVFSSTSANTICDASPTTLHEAILAEDVPAVKSFLTPTHISTALIIAARYNTSTQVIDALLEAGADINARGHDLETPLTVAARYNFDNLAVINTLLNTAGVQLDATNAFGTTALIWAALTNTSRVVNAIIEKIKTSHPSRLTAIVNMSNSSKGITALGAAVLNNDITVVNKLLAVPGIDVLYENERGETVLMFAAFNTRAVVDAIIGRIRSERGSHKVLAQINSQDNSGWAPLMYAAAFSNDHEVITTLLTEGADVNLKNHAMSAKAMFSRYSTTVSTTLNLQTALMLAVMRNKIHTVEALLQAPNISINLKNEEGWTALMIAAKESNSNIVQALVTHPRILINTCHAANKTALKIAQERGEAEVIAVFSSTRASTTCDASPTTLYEAILAEHLPSAQHLLNTADVNAGLGGDSGDSTALMIAARYNTGTDIIDELFKKSDINPNFGLRGTGETALAIAAKHSHSPVIIAALTNHVRTIIDLCTPGPIDKTALTLAQERTDAAKDPIILALETAGASTTCDYSPHIYNALRAGGRSQILLRLLTEENINNKIAGDTTTLMVAIRYSYDAPIIGVMLNFSNIDINAQTSQGWTALMLAAKYNAASVVSNLAAHSGIRINMCNTTRKTALKIAQERGDAGVIAAFTAAAGTTCGAETLLEAIQQQNINALRAFATSENINVPIFNEWPPLMYAVEVAVDGTVIAALLEEGANINHQITITNPNAIGAELKPTTALMRAAKLSSNTVIIEALAAAATPTLDPNIKNHAGNTAFAIAAASATDATPIKALLAIPNIYINTQDKNNATPLMYAAIHNSHAPVMKALVGAIKALPVPAVPADSINAQSQDGATALALAATHTSSTDVVEELLLGPDIQVNLADNNGRTPLEHAEARSANDIKDGIIALLKGKHGATRADFISAVKNEELENVKNILNAGMNPNARHNDSTALMVAAQYNSTTGVINELLKRDQINVNAILTDTHETALMIAARHNTAAVVTALASAEKVALKMCNSSQRSALDIARERAEEHKTAVIQVLASKITTSDCTPENLYEAILTEKLFDVQSFLSSEGADVNAGLGGDVGDSTALMIAARYNSSLVIINDLLKRNGINVNATLSTGETAFIIAAKHNPHATVITALAHHLPIQVNQCTTGESPKTALTIAEERTDPAKDDIKAALEAAGASSTCAPTSFLAAITGKDLRAIKAFAATSDLSKPIRRHLTPLMYAAERDEDGAMIAILLEAGANVNHISDVIIQKGPNGVVIRLRAETTTALMRAARYGSSAAITALAAATDPPLDPNIRNPNESTAFALAAQYGTSSDIDALLAIPGIYINTKDENGRTPLMHAAMSNVGYTITRNIVKAIKNLEPPAVPGDSLDAQDKQGRTALMHALLANNNRGVVYELLSVGKDMDITIKDNNNKRALDYVKAYKRNNKLLEDAITGVYQMVLRIHLIKAVIAEDTDRVTEVLNAGAFVNQVFESSIYRGFLVPGQREIIAPGGDSTALMIAARYNTGADVMNTLFAKGADILRQQSTHQSTPLMIAAQYNPSAAIITALIAHYNNTIQEKPYRDELSSLFLNFKNSDGYTALMLAARYNSHASVITELLKSEFVDANLKNNDGETALTLAVQHNNVDMVNALINNDRLLIDRCNSTSKTPIALARTRRDGGDTEGLAIVAALDNKGASTTCEAENLYDAIRRQRLSAVKYFNVPANYANTIAGDSTALMVAARYDNNGAIVRELITQASIIIRPNQQRQQLFSSFYNAAERVGNTTALMIAAKGNPNSAVMRELITQINSLEVNREGSIWPSLLIRSIMNAKDANNNTALMLAAEHNSSSSVMTELLKGKYIDINTKNEDGDRALTLAAQHNNAAVVNQLIGANSAFIDLCNGASETPLTIAKARVDTEGTTITTALETAGGTASCLPESFYDAIRQEDLRGVRAYRPLFDLSTDITENDSTALMIAARYNTKRTIVDELLTVHNHDIANEIESTEGLNALMILAKHNTSLAVAEAIAEEALTVVESSSQLLKHPMELVTRTDNDNNTALDMVTQRWIRGEVTDSLMSVIEKVYLFSYAGGISDSAGPLLTKLLSRPTLRINARDKNKNTALMFAIRNEWQRTPRLLIPHSALDLNAKNHEGSTALIIAAQYLNVNSVIGLISAGSRLIINACNNANKTALAVARAQEGLNKNATITHLEESGATTTCDNTVNIYQAILQEDLATIQSAITSANINDEIQKQLYDQVKVDLNSYSGIYKGYTPLMIAARYNSNRNVIDHILSTTGVDMTLRSDTLIRATNPEHLDAFFPKYTALMFAAKYNNSADVMRALIEKINRASDPGSILNVNFLGHTALMIAVRKPYQQQYTHPDVIRELLKGTKISVNYQNKLFSIPNVYRGGSHETALMLAAKNSSLEVVRVLLGAKGVNLFIKDQRDSIAVDYAVHRSSVDPIRSAVISLIGTKTLFKAAKLRSSKNKKVTEAANSIPKVLDAGISVNTRASGDSTALIYAARYNKKVDIINKLFDATDIDLAAVEHTKNSTALMMAARYNSKAEVMTQLVGKINMSTNPTPAALANAADSDGNTALMLAAQYSSSAAVVTALLGATDINKDATNNDGATALSLAQSRKAGAVKDAIIAALGGA